MCGIIGYIGKKEAWPVLYKGLERLEYRGYDSAGIALLDKGTFSVYKKKGRVAGLAKFLKKKRIMNFQAEWASRTPAGRLMAYHQTETRIRIYQTAEIL